MEDEFKKNTAEAIGIANEEQQRGTTETVKGYSFRASEELYHALREIVPEGSLSAAMRICIFPGQHTLVYQGLARYTGLRGPVGREKPAETAWPGRRKPWFTNNLHGIPAPGSAGRREPGENSRDHRRNPWFTNNLHGIPAPGKGRKRRCSSHRCSGSD